MKLLVSTNRVKNDPMKNCNSEYSKYNVGPAHCPYLCISQCSQKEVRCHKPSVAGMSPTGDSGEN